MRGCYITLENPASAGGNWFAWHPLPIEAVFNALHCCSLKKIGRKYFSLPLGVMMTSHGSILSIFLLCFLARAGQACDVPPEYGYRSSVVHGNLVFTLALDHINYLRGQPLRSYFGIENTSTDTARVCNGWSPMNILMVARDTCTALSIPCFNSSIFFYPPSVGYFGECIIIPPGGCEVRLVDWDGWAWDYSSDHIVPILPDPGSYAAVAALAHYPQPYYLPEQGIGLPITILPTSAVPVLRSSWGRLKAKY